MPQSGVLAGPFGWLRTRAPGETSHQDHHDCFWSLASSLGPDGQPMIAVDLFFDTLDLEEQFALVLILVVKRFLVKSVEFKYDTAVDLSSLSLSLCFWTICGVCLTAV